MTTTTTDRHALLITAQAADDTEFLELLAAAKATMDEAIAHHGHLDQMALQRAATAGATVLYGRDGLTYEVKTTLEYDKTKAGPVLEHFTPEEKAKCFTPAHEETILVPDKHDMTQIKAAARRHGNEALGALEAMTFPGRATGKLVRVAIHPEGKDDE